MNNSFKDFLKQQEVGINHMTNAGVIGLHMVSGPIVGFAIGYGLDALFSTHPWFKIIFLLVGILAGFLNVYRDTKLFLDKMAKNDQRSKSQLLTQDCTLQHAQSKSNTESNSQS